MYQKNICSSPKVKEFQTHFLSHLISWGSRGGRGASLGHRRASQVVLFLRRLLQRGGLHQSTNIDHTGGGRRWRAWIMMSGWKNGYRGGELKIRWGEGKLIPIVFLWKKKKHLIKKDRCVKCSILKRGKKKDWFVWLRRWWNSLFLHKLCFMAICPLICVLLVKLQLNFIIDLSVTYFFSYDRKQWKYQSECPMWCLLFFSKQHSQNFKIKFTLIKLKNSNTSHWRC